MDHINFNNFTELHKWNLNSDRSSISAYKLQCREIISPENRRDHVGWETITALLDSLESQQNPKKRDSYQDPTRVNLTHNHPGLEYHIAISQKLCLEMQTSNAFNSYHKLLDTQSSLQQHTFHHQNPGQN